MMAGWHPVARPSILIIEDEPSIAENLTYSLETDGFRPRWHMTGAGGLAALREEPAALVILDIGLPDMSGFEVCREIRKHSDVPILFLTAREGEIDRVAGLEMGGDDYVTKPFSPREVTARVRAILRRGERSSGNGVGAGWDGGETFLVQPEKRLISFRGRELNLTRYEYGLLALLVAHPGRVYTRDQLMDQVWEEPEASLDRTVDAHIKTLRAKLREIDGTEVILTHRGIGYSLREHR